jgi:hypothetical protein
MLPGLVVWLDDTVGVVQSPSMAGVVARWLDQSGQGNTANPVNTQGAAGFNFTIDPAVVNGHDAIICPANGTWLSISDGADVQFGTGDFGILVVERFAGSGDFVDKLDTMGGGPGWSLGLSSGIYGLTTASGSAVVAATNSGNFHIIAGRGALLRIAADTATGTGPTNTSDLDFVGGAMRLCFGGTIGIQNELAEVIVVKGTLSDANLANATAYLKTKFGL